MDDEIDFNLDDLFPLNTYVEEDVGCNKRELDENYERKKSRAKITRHQVSAKFDDLATYLKLARQRKYNRATIIQTALDHMKKQQQELDIVRCEIKRLRRQVKTVSLVHRVAENVNLFSWCDAQSLSNCSRVCRSWKTLCSDMSLWENLCSRRWNLLAGFVNIHQSNGKALWKSFDQANIMPSNPFVSIPVLGHARQNNFDAWVTIAQRTNRRTMRTVFIHGQPRASPVVELRLMLQNIDAFKQTIAVADISVLRRHSNAFQIASAENGEILRPRILTSGQEFTKFLSLGSYEFAVVSLFVLCPGCELEKDFIASVESIDIPIGNTKLSIRLKDYRLDIISKKY